MKNLIIIISLIGAEVAVAKDLSKNLRAVETLEKEIVSEEALTIPELAVAQTPGKKLRAVETKEKKLVGDETPCKQDGEYAFGSCFECCNFCEPVSPTAPADWKICTSNSNGNEQPAPSSFPTSANNKQDPNGMRPTLSLDKKKKRPTPSSSPTGPYGNRHPTPSANSAELGKNLRLVKPTEKDITGGRHPTTSSSYVASPAFTAD